MTKTLTRKALQGVEIIKTMEEIRFLSNCDTPFTPTMLLRVVDLIARIWKDIRLDEAATQHPVIDNWEWLLINTSPTHTEYIALPKGTISQLKQYFFFERQELLSDRYNHTTYLYFLRYDPLFRSENLRENLEYAIPGYSDSWETGSTTVKHLYFFEALWTDKLKLQKEKPFLLFDPVREYFSLHIPISENDVAQTYIALSKSSGNELLFRFRELGAVSTKNYKGEIMISPLQK